MRRHVTIRGRWLGQGQMSQLPGECVAVGRSRSFEGIGETFHWERADNISSLHR